MKLTITLDLATQLITHCLYRGHKVKMREIESDE